MTNKKIPSYLKLHDEGRAPPARPDVQELPGLDALLGAVRQATGWEVCYQRGGSDATQPRIESPGQLLVERPAAGDPPLPREAAETLASALSDVLGHWYQSRSLIWQREAELAAGVPVTPRPDEKKHLAARLEAVLKGGAEAVGCDAAAIYMLDDATSQLKMRACWGLPKERLFEPARPLRGAIADLEALIGHAVTLEDTSQLPQWKPPEDFPAAVCVPICSPSTPLGTMWVFRGQVGSFSDEQVNLLEIVAGRVAADLEREILVHQGLEAQYAERQLQSAAARQHDRLPRFAPLLDQWQVAGWTCQADRLGGDFYDWCVLPDGHLAVAVGKAHGELLEATLTACLIHTALKAHSSYRHDARQMLARINETIWTASPGDQFGSLFYAMVHPETGKLTCSCAGTVGALVVGPSRSDVVSQDNIPLGVQPESVFQLNKQSIAAGEALVVVSEGLCGAMDSQGQPLGVTRIARSLRSQMSASADDLVDAVRTLALTHCPGEQADDWTVLVAKRCG